MKPFDKSKVRNILIISLSNIGDVILTFPVIDILRHDFPQAKLTVVVGPKAYPLLKDNAHLNDVVIFDKRQTPLKMLNWISKMRKVHFDLVVDLRNTFIPFLIKSGKKTPLYTRNHDGMHMKEKHLKRLKLVYPFTKESPKKYSILVSEKDKRHVEELLERFSVKTPFVVIAPGAANHQKRWSDKGFAQIADFLAERHQFSILFVGYAQDKKIANAIIKEMKHPAANMCGDLSLVQLAYVFEKAFFAIVNDSAPMHLASYLQRDVLAIFGPSNPTQYGPWSPNCHFLWAQPVSDNKKEEETLVINSITPQQVLNSFEIRKSEVIFKKDHARV